MSGLTFGDKITRAESDLLSREAALMAFREAAAASGVMDPGDTPKMFRGLLGGGSDSSSSLGSAMALEKSQVAVEKSQVGRGPMPKAPLLDAAEYGFGPSQFLSLPRTEKNARPAVDSVSFFSLNRQRPALTGATSAGLWLHEISGRGPAGGGVGRGGDEGGPSAHETTSSGPLMPGPPAPTRIIDDDLIPQVVVELYQSPPPSTPKLKSTRIDLQHEGSASKSDPTLFKMTESVTANHSSLHPSTVLIGIAIDDPMPTQIPSPEPSMLSPASSSVFARIRALKIRSRSGQSMTSRSLDPERSTGTILYPSLTSCSSGSSTRESSPVGTLIAPGDRTGSKESIESANRAAGKKKKWSILKNSIKHVFHPPSHDPVA
ncbi:hypothetical protein BDK51DRAFT_40257 [Blyttiomyces helicus]|uniref:Uncharacterized protein n=1 Tax=Blyttiomyces helicus TaxID=388810 RepID=A0A4P9W9F7_9FUNG|nr:hypothetical protein BDK51DRAFT_40257 [Blyttiomyces helicus]|eukprot:RKO89191.1 hypothetical protein BDK51DRAFT_40257 [Blyttiomyces helicus]